MTLCIPVYGAAVARANARKLWNALKLEVNFFSRISDICPFSHLLTSPSDLPAHRPRHRGRGSEDYPRARQDDLRGVPGRRQRYTRPGARCLRRMHWHPQGARKEPGEVRDQGVVRIHVHDMYVSFIFYGVEGLSVRFP